VLPNATSSSFPRTATVLVQRLFGSCVDPSVYSRADSRSLSLICNAKCPYVAAERIAAVIFLSHEQKSARLEGADSKMTLEGKGAEGKLYSWG
jgi:hypothetical protein